MSLDIWLEQIETRMITVVEHNISHNLTPMAKEAGIDKALWRPDEIGIVYGRDLIQPLVQGISEMKQDPDRFKAFNPPNGWGRYEDFLPWLEKLLEGCKKYPNATIGVSR